MKCVCGNDKFIGHQVVRADIVVNQDGDFDSNLECGLDAAVYDTEDPYGPFTCTACGKEYDELMSGMLIL